METSVDLEASVFRPVNTCAIVTSPAQCWRAAQSSQSMLQTKRKQLLFGLCSRQLCQILLTRLIA